MILDLFICNLYYLQNYDFVCTAFMILSPNTVNSVDLQSGAYSYHLDAPSKGMKVSEVIILKEFIVRNINQTITPNFIDIGVETVKILIIYQDSPVSNHPVDITFTHEGSDKHFTINNFFTDKNGAVKLFLPAGTITISFVTSTGITIEFSEHIKKRVPITDKQKQLAELHIRRIFDSHVMISLDEHNDTNRPILLLGDVSGSMREETRMVSLRKTFQSIFESAMSKGMKIGLIIWDHDVTYCNPKAGSNPGYIDKSYSSYVLDWVEINMDIYIYIITINITITIILLLNFFDFDIYYCIRFLNWNHEVVPL